MANKRDIQAQIDDLTAQLEGADDDDEVWVKEGGREFKLTGSRAKSVLDRFADLFDSGDGDGDGDGDEDDEPPAKKSGARRRPAAKDKAPASGGYFGKRR